MSVEEPLRQWRSWPSVNITFSAPVVDGERLGWPSMNRNPGSKESLQQNREWRASIYRALSTTYGRSRGDGWDLALPVRVVATVHRQHDREGDAFNVAPIVKVAIDALVSSGILPDDNDAVVAEVLVRGGRARRRAGMQIEVYEPESLEMPEQQSKHLNAMHHYATVHMSNFERWMFDYDEGIRHIRYRSDSTGRNRWDRRWRRGLAAMFQVRFKEWEGFMRDAGHEGDSWIRKRMNRLLFRWADLVVNVRKDSNLPDGSVGGVITHWMEDGMYVQYMQPLVGQIVHRWILSDPSNPHAQEILRFWETFGDESAEESEYLKKMVAKALKRAKEHDEERAEQ